MQEPGLGHRPVVLFGAGNLGEVALFILRSRGVQTIVFSDNDTGKHGQDFHGCRVLAPGEVLQHMGDAEIFISSGYRTAIRPQLERMGFRPERIHDCDVLFEGVDLSAGTFELPTTEIQNIVGLYLYALKVARSPSKLYIRILDLVVTEKCSLRCQDCANLMQYYTHPANCDFDRMILSTQRFLQCIDGLYEARVLGGEPFMNKELHQFMRRLTACEGVDRIVLFTNGTIVPPAGHLESLQHPKVSVRITDYGELSRNRERLVTALETLEVPYHVTRPDRWNDVGKIGYRKRTRNEVEDVFRNCCVNDTYTLLHGELFRCPYSAHGINLGAMPRHAADYVNLGDDSVPMPELKAAVRKLALETTHLNACNYCAGRSFETFTIPPAIQARHPLAFTPAHEQVEP